MDQDREFPRTTFARRENYFRMKLMVGKLTGQARQTSFDGIRMSWTLRWVPTSSASLMWNRRGREWEEASSRRCVIWWSSSTQDLGRIEQPNSGVKSFMGSNQSARQGRAGIFSLDRKRRGPNPRRSRNLVQRSYTNPKVESKIILGVNRN
jgi:hypothetical protein